MDHRAAAIWLGLLLYLPATALAQVPADSNRITQGTNFDAPPPGGYGTEVEQGTLRIPGARLTKAYIWDPSQQPPTFARVIPSGVASPCPGLRTHCADSAMVIAFDSLQQSVSVSIIAFRARSTPVAVLRAYSREGVLVASSRAIFDTSAGALRRLNVQADSNRIFAVHLTVAGAFPTFFIDELSFTRMLPLAIVETDSAQQDPRIAVPNLIGLDLDSARARLAAAGLRMGTTRTVRGQGRVNHVIAQGPPRDSLVQPGSAVSVTVVAAPPPDTMATVPPVVGLSRDSAETALTRAGLGVGISLTNRDGAENEVITQGLPPGARVPRNTLVVITVVVSGGSTGPPWLLIAITALAAAALIWWLKGRPDPDINGENKPGPSTVRAVLSNNGLAPQHASFNEPHPLNLTIGYLLKVGTRSSITYRDDAVSTKGDS